MRPWRDWRQRPQAWNISKTPQAATTTPKWAHPENLAGSEELESLHAP